MNSLTGLKFSGRKQTTQSEIKKFKLRGLTSTVILAISMSVLGSGASLISMSSSAEATTVGDFQYTPGNGGAIILNYYGSSQNLTIPSVIDGLPVTTIGALAFNSHTGPYLQSIVIPNSVTTIMNQAFSGNGQLNSVIFGTPSSVTSIGDFAFAYDTALSSITLPNSLTAIGYGSFSNDSALTSITLPNSITSIGDAAFENDSSLTSITIPNSVTSIGATTFHWCAALTSITIPNAVTSIGNAAFAYDTALSSITLPNSLTSINAGAFIANTSLTSITIPNTVTSIGASAFYGDTHISFIDQSGFVATWSGTGGPYTTAQLRTATDLGQVTGTWASVVRVAPIIYSKPSAPSNVTVSLSNGTATVSFTPGSSGNLATYDEIDMYINGQLVGNVCNVTGATSCPISNLGPDAVFSFTVTAINSKGSAVSTVSNTVSYSSPAVVTTTSTSPPTTTTTVPPVKRTITCVKGKTTKKVTALSPVCPAGYKKK